MSSRNAKDIRRIMSSGAWPLPVYLDTLLPVAWPSTWPRASCPRGAHDGPSSWFAEHTPTGRAGLITRLVTQTHVPCSPFSDKGCGVPTAVRYLWLYGVKSVVVWYGVVHICSGAVSGAPCSIVGVATTTFCNMSHGVFDVVRVRSGCFVCLCGA